MKLISVNRSIPENKVAPVRERGLKLIFGVTVIVYVVPVAPVRERGLKLIVHKLSPYVLKVAPVRERGLKFFERFH